MAKKLIPMKNFANKNVSVFGLGLSGVATAKRLASLDAKVLVTESKPASDFSSDFLEGLQEIKIKLEFDGHTQQAIASADFIVVSPGIRLDLPLLKEAKARGIAIISEIELAYQILDKPIIAVTGTNGKTTTTTLIGEILKAAGKKMAVAGNIGFPLIAVDDENLDYIVAEISSYQLEAISSFRPWISVILNIQEDHLERHRSMQEYIKQKARIFINQTQEDHLVYNADDKIVSKMVLPAKAEKIASSKGDPEILGISPNKIRIPGRHNLENSLAAAAVASLCKINPKITASVLKSFSGVEHRIEFVRKIKNVEYYNDSKATNPNSTLVALETFDEKSTILILGGKDKGVGLGRMCQKIKRGVKDVILIGEATQRFNGELNRVGFLNTHIVKSIPEAVQTAQALGKPGDIVLLSPACSSFDMFTNFEERGQAFKTAVKQL